MDNQNRGVNIMPRDGNAPEDIKSYLEALGDDNDIPVQWRELLAQLAFRMFDLQFESGTKVIYFPRVVHAAEPDAEEIMDALGWKSKEKYQRGLKDLCLCDVIRKLKNGCYQINPEYANVGKKRELREWELKADTKMSR